MAQPDLAQYQAILAFALSALLALSLAQFALAQSQTKLSDPNTTFHRLYVQGAGKNAQEDGSFAEDKDELKGDLEQEENQAEDSTSNDLNQPTEQELRDAINELKQLAEPGDEVTIYFSGHGGGGPQHGAPDGGEEPFDEHFWLNKGADGQAGADDESVTDDELADMLEGFAQNVTLVIIMDNCFGGGFAGGADDIQESDYVTVIGTQGTCPSDPPGIFGGLIETLGETIADEAGEQECDTNDDGIVTAEELKECLTEQGWLLGPTDDSNATTTSTGNSKCVGEDGQTCDLPVIKSDRSVLLSPSGMVVTGSHFSPNSAIQVSVVDAHLERYEIGITESNSNGSFVFDADLTDFQEGPYLIIASDSEDNFSWTALEISSNPVTAPDLILVDAEGNRLEEALESGSQILVQRSIGNNLQFHQQFAYVVQVKDEQDRTVFLSWLSGELFPGQSFKVAQSWIADSQGRYNVETFVWDSVGHPVALAEKTADSVTIQ